MILISSSQPYQKLLTFSSGGFLCQDFQINHNRISCIFAQLHFIHSLQDFDPKPHYPLLYLLIMLIGNPVANESIFFPSNPYPTITQREISIAQQINNYKPNKPKLAAFNPGVGPAFHNHSILQFKRDALTTPFPIPIPTIPSQTTVRTSLVHPGAPTVIQNDRIHVMPAVPLDPQTVIPSSQNFDFNSSQNFIYQEPLVPVITPTYQQLLENQTMGVQMSMVNKNPSILSNDPMMKLRESAISKLDQIPGQIITDQPQRLTYFEPNSDYEQIDLELQRMSRQSPHHSVSSHIGSNFQVMDRRSIDAMMEGKVGIPSKTKARGIGLVTNSHAYFQAGGSTSRRSYDQTHRNSALSVRTISQQFQNTKQYPQHSQQRREEVFIPEINTFAPPEPSQKYAKAVTQVPVITPRILQIVKAYKVKQKTSNIENLNYQRGTSLGPHYVPSKHAYYLGEWANGLPWGFGKVIYDSNAYFQGFFVNGEAYCQNGLWIYPDSSYYIGGIIKSEPEGYGEMVYRDRELVYQGQWRSGKPHGQGKQKFKDGSVYQGQFANGLKNGVGKFVWSDGSFYSGQFKNGFMQGKGEKTNSNGSQFIGQFHNNLICGQGRYITNQGEYIGQLLLNKRSGKGVYKSHNGDIFQGEFENDLPNGTGKLTLANGKVIEGVWSNGTNVSISKVYQ